MSRAFRFASLTAFLVVVLGSVACAQIYPTVEFVGFTPSTWMYEYKVTVLSTNWYCFDNFEVDAYVLDTAPPSESDPDWTGPWSGTTNMDWAKRKTWWDPQHHAVYDWSADTYEKQIWPGAEDQIVYFRISVPNSAPVTGNVITRQLFEGGSVNVTNTQVPGAVPEPASLVALGAFVLPLLVRRRGR